MFDGDLYLNTSPATRFYRQDDPEHIETESNLSEDIRISPVKEHELNEEDLSMKTISQILSFVDVAEPQEKEFLCSARIVDIITRNGWYNISCAQCYNRIKPRDGKLICRYCQDSKFIGVVRFRLKVIVDDETDQGRFVIFDRDASKLTNMQAEDLITFEGLNPTYANQQEMPSCLKNLIGKRYIFQLSLTKFDFKAQDKTFSVAGIVSGPIKSPTKLPNKKRVRTEGKDTCNKSEQEGKRVKLDDLAIAIEGMKQLTASPTKRFTED